MKRTQAKPAQKAVPLSAALFFSKTLDFLEVFIPKQKDGSKNTVETYRTSLSMFRDYVRDEKNLSIRDFQFADCTYDLVLDYRNWLHDTRNFKESTTNNRLAVIKSYIAYAAARDITLQQIAFAVSEVPLFKYNFSSDKVAEVYEKAGDQTAMLPKDTMTKLLIKQAIGTLNAVSATLERLKTEMLNLASQLPEFPVVMAMRGVGYSLGPQLTFYLQTFCIVFWHADIVLR